MSRALSAAQISVLHLSAITNMKNQKTRDQDLCKHFNPSISQDCEAGMRDSCGHHGRRGQRSPQKHG